MKPIIDPIWIYVIENLDSLHGFIFVCILVSILYALYCFAISSYYKENMTENMFKNEIKELDEMGKLLNESKEMSSEIHITLSNKNDDIFDIKNILNNILDRFKRINVIIHDELYDVIWEYRKKGYKTLIGILILTLLYHFIPTTDLGYKMLVSSYITEDKIKLDTNFNKEYINWTIKNIIEEIKNLK